MPIYIRLLRATLSEVLDISKDRYSIASPGNTLVCCDPYLTNLDRKKLLATLSNTLPESIYKIHWSPVVHRLIQLIIESSETGQAQLALDKFPAVSLSFSYLEISPLNLCQVLEHKWQYLLSTQIWTVVSPYRNNSQPFWGGMAIRCFINLSFN